MIHSFLSAIQQPAVLSHKAQNGKALIIGGSDLFHAASQWSFLVVSRWVDMTFYSSVAENNELLRDAKMFARDGVVVPREQLVEYLKESDVILIGPGMRRDVESTFPPDEIITIEKLSLHDWEQDTTAITAALLRAGTEKRWVIDAGALQVLRTRWLPKNAILTPHQGEFESLILRNELLSSEEWLDLQAVREKIFSKRVAVEPSRPAQVEAQEELLAPLHTLLQKLSQKCSGATFLLKGPVDIIWNTERCVLVSGGNAGMTKGGTGDVLAGIVTAFRATSEAFPSTVVASYLNKQAAHELFLERGLMYNASDLAEQLPRTWKKLTT